MSDRTIRTRLRLLRSDTTARGGDTMPDGLLHIASLAALQVLLDEAGHDIELTMPPAGRKVAVGCGLCGEMVHIERRDRRQIMTAVPGRMLIACEPLIFLTIVVAAPPDAPGRVHAACGMDPDA